MGIVQRLQQEIEEAQESLARLLTYPEDTFPVGTVALITAQQNTVRSYYLKIGEELWKRLTNPTDHNSRELIAWILKYASETNHYFEVYVMQPGENPIYARPE